VVAGGRFGGSEATGADGGGEGEPGRQRFRRPRERGSEDRAGGVTACDAAARGPRAAAGGRAVRRRQPRGGGARKKQRRKNKERRPTV
jgi:hypothetical protein